MAQSHTWPQLIWSDPNCSIERIENEHQTDSVLALTADCIDG